MSVHVLKQRAKRLRNVLKSDHDLSLSVAQSLEIIAQEESFPDWNTASARWSQPPGSNIEQTDCTQPGSLSVNIFSQSDPNFIDSHNRYFRFMASLQALQALQSEGAGRQEQNRVIPPLEIIEVIPLRVLPDTADIDGKCLGSNPVFRRTRQIQSARPLPFKERPHGENSSKAWAIVLEMNNDRFAFPGLFASKQQADLIALQLMNFVFAS